MAAASRGGRRVPRDSRASGPLREDALAIFLRGVEAAEPGNLVRHAIRIGIGGGAIIERIEVVFPGTLRVVAVGKAAVSMARAVNEALPASAFTGPGIAVVHDESAAPLERFRVLPAGHPVPDSRGEAGAREIEAYVSGARREDGLLLLLSGGGSALLPAPANGITLEEKAAVTRLLLASGADIREVNTVRKHLSRLKGGGLAAVAHPAATEAFILSDVLGDDLSSIASGPTAPDPTTFEDARAVLEHHGVWRNAPGAVRERIEKGLRGEVRETPKPGAPVFARVRNRILGSNSLSLDAAARKAVELGHEVEIASRALTGEARDAAKIISGLAARPSERVQGLRRALLAGGETTVTVRGSGLGGRNQEVALAFAMEMERSSLVERPSAAPWAFLSAGTDGRDGPTDAAGAIVDSGTLARGRKAGLDPARALEENDAYRFLDAAGDLLRTGPTGTNVADLQVYIEG
ncbi:MAG TPA: DUF4147 domain-containing protein [Planctomycetota bacterium]|nr:DUF4147 domain-containing protein [Planctomycetota bacterium]